MKFNFILFIIPAITLTSVSCDRDIDHLLNAQKELVVEGNNIFTYDMFLDAKKITYDGTTRATTASDWENGDIIYLRFSIAGSSFYGKAEYLSPNNKWRVTCEKELIEATNALCSVWYAKGVNPTNYSSSIDYDYLTEVYNTDNAQYTYTDNNIFISATMKPEGWRLRFKGTVGTEIQVYTLDSFYKGHLVTFTNGIVFTVKYFVINLTVGDDGYTDYFVGMTLDSCNKITIRNSSTGDSFYRYFDSNTLKEGESGCFTIPTKSDLHGWTLSE